MTIQPAGTFDAEHKERIKRLRAERAAEYWRLNEVGIVENQRAILVAVVVMQYKTVRGGQKFIAEMNEAIIDSWMGYGWQDRYRQLRKRTYGKGPLLAVLDAYRAVLGNIRRMEEKQRQADRKKTQQPDAGTSSR